MVMLGAPMGAYASGRGGGGGGGFRGGGGGYRGGGGGASSYGGHSSFAGRSYGGRPSFAFGGSGYRGGYRGGYGGGYRGWYGYGGGYGWGNPYDGGIYYYPSYSYDESPQYSDYGSSNADSVSVQVQEQLAQTGYYTGPVDGIVGPKTHAAISAFQHDNGLPVTGNIDTGLLKALQGY